MFDAAVDLGLPYDVISQSIANTVYLKKVIDFDRSQSAFRLSFIDFSNRAINDYRLINGKKNIQAYKNTFSKARQLYGVPPEVIASFWAMETDFGAVQGSFHTLSALATLGFDCRRSNLFQVEYLAAIRLVVENKLDVKKSTGAWAGEFGQIQMLPSDILSFAVDGNEDGRVRLNDSAEDVILTAAAVIAGRGWKPSEPWFDEVLLPYDFPWREAGLGRSRPLQDWLDLGLKFREDNFFRIKNTIEATLILPQGRKGPKFLAYSNFNIFLKWNDSFMYSTTAALLAKRLVGDQKHQSENPEEILSIKKMTKLQKRLIHLGYDVGKLDGILGAKTRQAVRSIQMRLGLPADSWPNNQLLRLLNL